MTFEELVKEAVEEISKYEGEILEICVAYDIEPAVVYKTTKRNLEATIILMALRKDTVATLEAFGCTMMTLGIAVGRKMEANNESG